MTTPTTNTNPMDDFRQRVTDKLKQDIGEMLPDDVMQQLTERAVEEMFFKERRIRKGFGNDEIKPSWFVEEVAKHAEPIIRESVKTFVDKHKAEIEAAIHRYMSDQNLALVTSTMIANQMSGIMYQHVDQIVNTIIHAPKY